MCSIFAGTGFNQIIQVHSNQKSNHKQVYGTIARFPVKNISVDLENEVVFYSNDKSIYSAYKNGNIEELVKLKQNNIVGFQYSYRHNAIRYFLSDGSIHAVRLTNSEGSQIQNNNQTIQYFNGQKHNKFKKVVWNIDRQKFLFFGDGVVPIIANVASGLLDWYGKNVKNDELDLEVPIKDVDAKFIRDQKFIAILNFDNKLRIYDIRGTHRRPIQDIKLQTTPKSHMTQMKVSQNQNQYYFSNDIGQIYKCDSRKNWKVISKYKGITSTVTGIEISERKNMLIASSLDSYIRIYDLQTTKPIKKIYVNKPIYCIDVVEDDDDEQKKSVQEGNQEQLDLQQVEQEPQRVQRLKKIRKRNKVGLKYLQPRQFDEPEIKQQQVIAKQWYQGLNPIDRRQFEQ